MIVWPVSCRWRASCGVAAGPTLTGGQAALGLPVILACRACRRGPRAKPGAGRWLKNHPTPRLLGRAASHVPPVTDGVEEWWGTSRVE